MDTKAKPTAAASRYYDDFVPPTDWIKEENLDMLIIELPGFKKEHVRVQLDNFGNLRTSGERPMDNNRWRRFRKEFRIPDTCNASEIRAKFEDGLLIVTLPNLNTEAEPVPVPVALPSPPPPAPEDKPIPKPTEAEPVSAKQENLKGVHEKVDYKSPPPPEPLGAKPMPELTEQERDSAKKENAKGVNERSVDKERIAEVARNEEVDGYGGDGPLVRMKMKIKNKQLMINVAVASVGLVGVGIYVAYKFRNAGEACTGEQSYFEF